MVASSRSWAALSTACLCAGAHAASSALSMQKRDPVWTIVPITYDIDAGTTTTPFSDLTLTWDEFNSGAKFSFSNTTWLEYGGFGDVIVEGNRTALDTDSVYIVEVTEMQAVVTVEGELDIAISDRVSLYRYPPMSTYDNAATSVDILGDEIDLNFEIDLSIEIALVLTFDAAIKFTTGFNVSVPGGLAVIYNSDNGEILLSQALLQDATLNFDGFKLDEGTEVTASAALQVRAQAGLSFDEHTWVAGADANIVNVTVSAGISDDCDFYIEGAVDSGIDVYYAALDSDNDFDTNPDPVWADTFTVWTTWSTCEIPASTSTSSTSSVSQVPESLLGPHTTSSSVSQVPESLLGPHTTSSSVSQVPESLLGPHTASSTSSVSGVPVSLLGPHYISSTAVTATAVPSTSSVSGVPLSLLGPHYNSSNSSTATPVTISPSSFVGSAYTTKITKPASVTGLLPGTQVSGTAVGTGGLGSQKNSSSYTSSPLQPSAYAGDASKTMIAGSAFLLAALSFIAVA